MNTYDFITRLRNGESPDDIANEVAAALNTALETIQKEEKEDEKLDRTNALLTEIDNYLADFYPELLPYAEDTTAEDFIAAMDKTIPELLKIIDLVDCFDLKINSTPIVEKKESVKDPITLFLKKNNLI